MLLFRRHRQWRTAWAHNGKFPELTGFETMAYKLLGINNINYSEKSFVLPKHTAAATAEDEDEDDGDGSRRQRETFARVGIYL